MAADDPKFGIRRFTGEYIDEVKTKKKVEVAVRKNRVGVSKRIYPHDPTTDVNISGGGTAPLAVGVVTSHGVTGISGGLFVVKEAEETDKNTDFDDFAISATHYPDGEAGALHSTPET